MTTTVYFLFQSGPDEFSCVSLTVPLHSSVMKHKIESHVDVYTQILYLGGLSCGLNSPCFQGFLLSVVWRPAWAPSPHSACLGLASPEKNIQSAGYWSWCKTHCLKKCILIWVGGNLLIIFQELICDWNCLFLVHILLQFSTYWSKTTEIIHFLCH